MIYREQQDEQGLALFTFGADNCVKELRWATGFPAIQVQKGPKDQILLMFKSSATVLYSDTYGIMTSDILDLGDGKVMLVIGRDSPSNLTEIYVIQDQDLRRLSHHGDAIAKLDIADAEFSTQQRVTTLSLMGCCRYLKGQMKSYGQQSYFLMEDREPG